MVIEEERSRTWAYVLVALTAFLAGMAMGQLGAVRGAGTSRVEWPAPSVPHPRALQP